MLEIKNFPLITIGITSYNASDTIERAIKSAFDQTWPVLEVVVVDDCSVDGTQEILFNFAKVFPELRVFSNETNGGVAVTRNRILSEARGEFVVFFDDDDLSLPDRVQRQYLRIVEYEEKYSNGAPVICHSARLVRYPNGDERTEQTMGQTEGRAAPSGLAVARRILIGEPLKDGYGACPTCSQMARISTYQMLGGFDPAFRRGEDTDLNIRLAKIGGHFVGIAFPLVVQFMTKTAEKSLAVEHANNILLLEKHRSILDQEGQYDFCHRWLDIKLALMERRYFAFVLKLFRLVLSHPVLTARRMLIALPNLTLNLAFSRFHVAREKM